MYGINVGKQKRAKYMTFPWAANTLIGKIELIKIPNRLEHGVSYTYRPTKKTQLSGIFNEEDTNLPTDILPWIPTGV